MTNKYQKIFVVVTFLIICYFPIFLHLDALTIRMWDESFPAVYALEMAHDNNWMITGFGSIPDDFYPGIKSLSLIYVKPLMLIWLQAISIKFLGDNELAVRLPVAIASYLTVIFLFYFGVKYLKSWKIGFLSGIILISTNGYIENHVARTGDVDGMLILWITVCLLSYFLFLHAEPEKRNRYFFITVIALTLAGLTKGIAALLPLPALFIYTLLQHKLHILLQWRKFYLGVLLFLVVVGGYYLLREHYQPGYLQTVYEHDIVRYSQTHDGHTGEFFMYFKNLITRRNYCQQGYFLREQLYTPWCLLLPICFILGLLYKEKLLRNLSIFCGIYIIIYLLVISFSQTKLDWYTAPIFPFTALLLAMGFHQIYNAVLNYFQLSSLTKKFVVFILLIFSFIALPYKQIISKVYFPKDKGWGWGDLLYGDYLRKITKEGIHLNKFQVIHTGYNGHLVFYAEAMNYQGKQIQLRKINDEFQVGDIVVTCQAETRMALEKKYNLKWLDVEQYCITYQVEGKKDD